MVYESFYRDFYWEQYGVDSLEYWLAYEGTPIFVGKAFKSPDASCIRINVSRILRDYVWNDMPDFRPIDGDFVSHPDALKKFDLYDGTGTLLEEYVVYFSFEDFNLPELTYRGIDGWADPRQKIFFPSTSDSAWTQSYDVSEFFFNIWDVSVPKEGGLIRIPYETNMKDYQYYFEAPSGVTVSSFGRDSVTVIVDENDILTDRFLILNVRRTSDGELIATCTITQEGTGYFNCDSDEFIPQAGGLATIEIDTNVPISAITYELPDGFTGVSFTSDSLVISVPENEGEGYEASVYFKWGASIVGITKVHVARKEYFECPPVIGVPKEGGQFVIYFHTNISSAEINPVLPDGFTFVSMNDYSLTLSVSQNYGATYTKQVSFLRQSATLGTTDVTVYGESGELGEYLTIEVLDNSGITTNLRIHAKAANQDTIKYSKNGGEWTTVTNSSVGDKTICSVTDGDKVRLKATWDNNNFYYSYEIRRLFMQNSDCKFKVYGNAMSLVYEDNFNASGFTSGNERALGSLFSGSSVVDASGMKLPCTVLGQYIEYAYANMFRGCKDLLLPPELPATTFVSGATYMNMFSGCTSLTTAPSLPATQLSTACYSNMFADCQNLTVPPLLAATVMELNAYEYMFSNCTSLVTAPSLPAQTLANGCYRYMFDGCTRLLNAPALNAPIMSGHHHCYERMFQNCTSLVNGSVLSSSTVETYCCSSMYRGCTSLVWAQLPSAGEMKSNCFSNMFNGCTSLVTAPWCNPTSYATSCFMGMFKDCTSLVNAPESLPNTTGVAKGCGSMFDGCTSLVTAPVLKAKRVDSNGYGGMFSGCTNLTSITVEFEVIDTSSPTPSLNNWVAGVSPTGVFTKPSGTSLETGDSGIPTGWSVVNV